MNNVIDYSLYNITSTTQFDNGLAELKANGYSAEVKKLFRLIDEIIQNVDMTSKEKSRILDGSNKMYHIHLDGVSTGDIVLLYKVSGKDIDLDLRLYNITDHKDMDRVSRPKYEKRQSLHKFDVIPNKYTETQIEYAETAYFDLISDYRLYQLKGDAKRAYTEDYLHTYYEVFPYAESLSYEEFLEIIHYIESINKKSIFGSILPNKPQHTATITDHEERYILTLIQDYGLDIKDAYIETEVDEYGDAYEYMYVKVISNDYKATRLLESELYSLDQLFGITFDSYRNGLGAYGKTYEFSHYFL